MTILIRTPEYHAYAIAIVLTLSLGCSNIASHLYSRWFYSANNVILIHWLLKSVIILLGLFLIPIESMFSGSLVIQAVSVPLAIIIGILCVNFEKFINRSFRPRKINEFKSKNKYVYHDLTKNMTHGLSSQITLPKINLKNIHEHHAGLDSDLRSYQLRDIVLVAISEEIIFRGFLYQMAVNLHSLTLCMFANLLITILFGASHITFGKGQFISKILLGTSCLTLVIMTHCLLPAIIIHVVFNVVAYNELSKLSNAQ